MQRTYHVIAIGGGGFTHGEDPDLDIFCLRGLPERPRLGFIGAASKDDPDKIARFHARFSDHAASLSHLPLSAGSTEAAEWAEQLDLIYVGGGNTAYLVRHLRETGIADVLAEATARGTRLAGVSAGAVCWFDMVLTDSLGGGLRPMRGLGLVPGSCCPHFSSEPHRKPAFHKAVANGDLPAGLAIDDGAAVRLSSHRDAEVFSARANASAYRLTVSQAAGCRQTEIPPALGR